MADRIATDALVKRWTRIAAYDAARKEAGRGRA